MNFMFLMAAMTGTSGNKGVSALLVKVAQDNTLPKSCARELLALACEQDHDSFGPSCPHGSKVPLQRMRRNPQ
jgi:hypothetical protein